jgi:hypothetical protein
MPRTVFIIQTKNLETNIAPSFLHFWVLDRHERGIIAMIPKDEASLTSELRPELLDSSIVFSHAFEP